MWRRSFANPASTSRSTRAISAPGRLHKPTPSAYPATPRMTTAPAAPADSRHSRRLAVPPALVLAHSLKIDFVRLAVQGYNRGRTHFCALTPSAVKRMSEEMQPLLRGVPPVAVRTSRLQPCDILERRNHERSWRFNRWPSTAHRSLAVAARHQRFYRTIQDL